MPTDANGEYRQVPPSDIKVPDMRVTAVWEGDLHQELVESIRSQGILQPLQVEEVDGDLWLIDGLHRLQVALELALETVPCVVKEGDADSVLIRNLVVNRQRGRSNPAQEARLIRTLREEGGKPLEDIAALTGLSVGWTRRLHDLSYLPPEVLDLVGEGKLGITHAAELLRLEDPAQQLEVAHQAIEWRYTAEQVRIRVAELLNPERPIPPGGTVFDAGGRPQRVPIPCYVCHVDLTGAVNYLYICGPCQSLVDAFLQAYYQHDQEDRAAGTPAPFPEYPQPTPDAAGPA